MRIQIIALVIVAFGCSVSQMNKGDFNNFYTKVPILNFPILIDCKSDYEYFDKSTIEDSLGFKYCPENWYINGRILTSENYIILVYSYPGDFMYPSIFTFTLDGQAIDTLNLGTSCGEWHGNVERGIIKITEDLNINFIDSLIIYETDEDENIVHGTGSAKVMTKDFSIDNNGYFKHISEKIDKAENIK